LDAGAYGYLVSRTALLHPQGETFDASMGLRGLFEALTTIAAQPEKDFGELVRQRGRKRGLPVAPAEKTLPCFAPPPSEDQLSPVAVDAAAAVLLQNDAPVESLYSARVRLAERRLAEALLALEEAGQRDASDTELTRLEGIYAYELSTYTVLVSSTDGASSG
jgi:hypothetical protein